MGRYRQCMTGHPSVELRRVVLAVSVLCDVDLLPRPDGVLLTGVPALWLSWSEVTDALAGADAESPVARHRVARWMRHRRWLSEWTLDELAAAARPVALPVGHALHAGPAWVRARVL